MNTPVLPIQVARLPFPYRPEEDIVVVCTAVLDQQLDWPDVINTARPWVKSVRAEPAPFWAMESLLREYPISSAEGLALMRLAEALLRVPDAETAVALTADQLGRADFEDTSEGSPHKMLAQLSAAAIGLSKRFLPDTQDPPGLVQRLGARTVVAATVRAIQLLGRQFVLGRDIGEAMAEANTQRAAIAQPVKQRKDLPALRFSYDMLGEGARTEVDAKRYLASYSHAIQAIAAGRKSASPMLGDGISIKLSALFSRYEDAQRERVMHELLPRVQGLIDLAAPAQLNLTIDAEESDRLELSLEIMAALAGYVATRYPQWQGFGLAVQAYQTRALEVVDEVARLARAHQLHFMVRLVKGAYWDGEIKRAQEGGLPGYPVFTQKQHTDISYLACAQRLFSHADVIYPQFATHNAGTIAAILQLAQRAGQAAADGSRTPAPFEMQRLHGMGESVYREVLKDRSVPCRVYAPVGEHRDLLAYLVRRLLENGANSSFVHQLADTTVSADLLLGSPLEPFCPVPLLLPLALYGQDRPNAKGVDLACLKMRAPLDAALAATRIEVVAMVDVEQVEATMQRLQRGFAAWSQVPLPQRAAVLRRAADMLEARLPEFCGLLVKEAHKTLGDCVSEVREAVDFCRYYAHQAEQRLSDQNLPGPTGESNLLRLHGRGVFVCISPWNFPLAIFAGQVVAALVAGNAVAAKPAEQTPRVALRFAALLHAAGLPADALACLHGLGQTVGAALVAHPLNAGVCFTGSTQVARLINRSLAARDGAIVPLIAETGGLNAMVVDSSALPEQVIDAVVQSAFRSAGQRCSALRLLCVHESAADAMIEMLRGALQELRLGDPADLATDVGPIIDDEAFESISRHVQALREQAPCLGESPNPGGTPRMLPPVAFELPRVAALKSEIFGPVLHVVRWGPGCQQAGAARNIDELVAQINALGYGLTLGVQTRIDSRAQRIAKAAKVGNVYVNRNMIGAVVGVQPFGGEGLSGTGPKAGGPYYLYRFCVEQTVTVNTAAAGGNAELLAGLTRPGA